MGSCLGLNTPEEGSAELAENDVEEGKKQEKKKVVKEERTDPTKCTKLTSVKKKEEKLPPAEDMNILDDLVIETKTTEENKTVEKKVEKKAVKKVEKKKLMLAITPSDLAKKKKKRRKTPGSKKKTPKKNKFLGDPWDQLSSWNDKDDTCEKFMPGYPHVFACKTCSRTIESHRRTAVHEAQFVLAAIDARGEASRVLSKEDGIREGELWLGGQVAVSSTFFEARKIKLCLTIAVGLGQGFRKRRNKICSKFGTRVVQLKWKDNATQKIDREELLKACYEIEWSRRAGKSVLVHCAAGQSRSSTVVIAYMRMFAHNSLPKPVSVERALEFTRKKRPMVRPNKGFRAQLTEFESMGVFDNVVLPPAPISPPDMKKEVVVVKEKEEEKRKKTDDKKSELTKEKKCCACENCTCIDCKCSKSNGPGCEPCATAMKEIAMKKNKEIVDVKEKNKSDAVVEKKEEEEKEVVIVKEEGEKKEKKKEEEEKEKKKTGDKKSELTKEKKCCACENCTCVDCKCSKSNGPGCEPCATAMKEMAMKKNKEIVDVKGKNKSDAVVEKKEEEEKEVVIVKEEGEKKKTDDKKSELKKEKCCACENCTCVDCKCSKSTGPGCEPCATTMKEMAMKNKKGEVDVKKDEEVVVAKNDDESVSVKKGDDDEVEVCVKDDDETVKKLMTTTTTEEEGKKEDD